MNLRLVNTGAYQLITNLQMRRRINSPISQMISLKPKYIYHLFYEAKLRPKELRNRVKYIFLLTQPYELLFGR